MPEISSTFYSLPFPPECTLSRSFSSSLAPEDGCWRSSKSWSSSIKRLTCDGNNDFLVETNGKTPEERAFIMKMLSWQIGSWAYFEVDYIQVKTSLSNLSTWNTKPPTSSTNHYHLKQPQNSCLLWQLRGINVHFHSGLFLHVSKLPDFLEKWSALDLYGPSWKTGQHSFDAKGPMLSWSSRQHIPLKVDRSWKDFMISWLVVEPTHLKNISQKWNLPQIGVKIKNIWKHHLVSILLSYLSRRSESWSYGHLRCLNSKNVPTHLWNTHQPLYQHVHIWLGRLRGVFCRDVERSYKN